MEYRDLGKSGLKVSEVMLGTWAMGGNQWGDTDDAESIAAIKKAIDLGITTIDTAPAYGYGHSEELVGKAIKGHPRESIVIATKMGISWDEERPFYIDDSRERVFQEVEESLRRLDTDYIDLYQVHWPDRETQVEETIQAMAEIKAQGKIRHIGVCNFNVELMERALSVAPIASLQPEYNLMQRRIEDGRLQFSREHGIGVIAYGPLNKGLLTGKFRGDESFPDNDVRHADRQFIGETFRENVSKVEQLRPIAEKYGKSLAELAIRWILEQPGISAAIVGAKRPSQVEDNAGATGWKLSPEDEQRMREIFA